MNHNSFKVLIKSIKFLLLTTLLGNALAFGTEIELPLGKTAVLPEFYNFSSHLVEIGKGRRMYLQCQGRGAPTVVFISGRTDRANIWQTTTNPAKKKFNVFSEVAKFTHCCAYDRPGTVTIVGNTVDTSRSTSVLQPTTPINAVADLHALLKKSKVTPPYVLVSHSYGGLIARLYASIYPQSVAGLVLIDTLTEFLYDTLSPPEQSLWVRLNSNYSKDLDEYIIQERTDFISGFEQLRKASSLHEIPTIVLTSDQPYDFKALIDQGVLPPGTPIDSGPTVFKAHLKGQQQLARLLNAKHITKTQAGHYIQNEQPQLVIEAIREVVDTTRKERIK
ncbi:MAG: alpha/beta hydrolase [Candidatus Protochlamydia sp.]|nr:alpha/beta hydrolase [Candidatus Protochlamydia sp.]